MATLSKKQNRITIIMLIILVLNISMWYVPDPPGYFRVLFGLARTVIFCALILIWCFLTRNRLTQKGIRRYITMFSGFLIMWFLFRGLKYYVFPTETTASRYLWYLYYIPLMFYPVCALLAVCYIGRREDWERPQHSDLLFVVSAVISAIVLTNDVNQFVFVFPPDAVVKSDAAYSYGPLYILPFTWFLICTMATLIVMIRRCRIPKTHRAYSRLPLLPPFLGLIYGLLYVTRHTSFYDDLTTVMSVISVATFEAAIRVGYIRSNSNYQDIFYRSSIAAEIFDEKLNLQYASSVFPAFENEILYQTLEHGHYTKDTIRYAVEPIRGGYLFWKEDVSELIRIREQRASANLYLKDHNMVLKKNYETKIKRRKLEEQNQLYNEMQNQTRDRLYELDRLLHIFEEAQQESEENDLLFIGVLTAYLKRRNNLIFLAKDDSRIPISELKHCMRETSKMLDTFGISCMINITAQSAMSFEQMVKVYDAFEMVIEETAQAHPTYFVTVTNEKDACILRMRVAGIDCIPKGLGEAFISKEEDDGEYLLEKRI